MIEVLKITGMILLFIILIIAILIGIVSIREIVKFIFKGDKNGNDR